MGDGQILLWDKVGRDSGLFAGRVERAQERRDI